MLTIRNTTCEPISRELAQIGGHEIRITWGEAGPVVDQSQLRSIRDAGGANWSNEEIDDLAIHCESLMAAAYERLYRIAYPMADGGWDVVDTFPAIDDAAANAHAAATYTGDEWFVLDDQGRNINGGRDQE